LIPGDRYPSFSGSDGQSSRRLPGRIRLPVAARERD